MSYSPLKTRGSQRSPKTIFTSMAPKGVDLLNAPQFLNINNALQITNYLLSASGELEKRGGLDNLFTVSGGKPTYMLEKFDDDNYMYAYDDKMAVYNITGDASTVINTFSAASTTYSGQKYGPYFFITNDLDKPGYIVRSINYDALTSAFTAGKTLTGGTSGATATILNEGNQSSTYTPAFLTGGNSATSNFATWAAVTDGSFKITIDGVERNITGIDFTGDSSMAEVAATIQVALRAVTGGTETVVWSTNHFVISSADTTVSSAITVTSSSPGWPPPGTNISGEGGVAFLDADSGQGTVTNTVENAAGVLHLTDIVGIFQDNEPLTDDGGGSATADGIVGWNFNEVSAMPICKILKVIGNRLFAGNLLSDETAVAYSAADVDGANPPFSNWTVATGTNDPGLINYRNAGGINAIEPLGDNIVVFAEDGKWAFRIDTIDSAGTLTKVDNTVINRLDAGGASGALLTPNGLFYINEKGLWQMQALGQTDIPFSDQEFLTSRLLGNDYFDDITLTNADIVYSQKYNTLFITCANDNATNNYIITYNFDNKAFAEFTGWNINRWLNDTETIYGASADATEVWTCFSGLSDDGSNISTTYLQELSVGSLETIKELSQVYVHGFLSETSSLTVGFDIYDRDGEFVDNKLQYTWTPQKAGSYVEDFSGGAFRIKNFQRIRVQITAADKVAHKITYIILHTREKRKIRRRTLVKV